ncbi:MAG: NUDIX hydrolase [Magnetococcales bacterium]|nr:NUDIX hydrolase [Magnetococcales bacterium]
MKAETLEEILAQVESGLDNPHVGLPEPLFRFISRLTPLVNVDLLIQDGSGRTLLAWRDDPLAGKGWHLPGGIVRFQERLLDRVAQVALSEVGEPVTVDPHPLAMHEIIDPAKTTRGHFISVLYRCHPSQGFVPDNGARQSHDPGFLSWFAGCPDDLLRWHEIYRSYL